MAVTMLTALRLATKAVTSLHNVIGAARTKHDRTRRWRARRGSRTPAPASILVRHFAVELVPSLLEDYETRLRAEGRGDVARTFAQLRRSIGARA
jgi:hypothetical protein